MKIVKSNYESYKKRVNNDILDSPLAKNIESGKVSYFEILNDDNSYITNFEVWDEDSNWLAINIHDKKSIINDKELMNLILSELKKYYSSLVLRVDEKFKERIDNAKLYGFKEKSVKKQGNYNYVELKIEL